MDNAGYGEIRDQMAERDDPVLAVDIERLDFAALGRSLGCDGVYVEDRAAFASALEGAFAADRPTVVHLEGAQPRSSSRAMISRWMSEVPSSISSSFASRIHFSTGYSRE